MTSEQAEQARTGFGAARDALMELRNAGVPVDDDRVQRAIADHYQWICLFWTPGRDAYKGLADMYVGDARFRENIGAGDDALVEYMRDAIKVYADARLS